MSATVRIEGSPDGIDFHPLPHTADCQVCKLIRENKALLAEVERLRQRADVAECGLAFERVTIAEQKEQIHTLRTRLHFERAFFPSAETVDELIAYADFFGGAFGRRGPSPERERALRWLGAMRRLHEEKLAPAITEEAAK